MYPKVYHAEKIIGNGSFGVVYKALHEQKEPQERPMINETVAIKKVFQDKRYKNREL